MSGSAPPSPPGSGRERRAEPRFEVELWVRWQLGTYSGTAVVRDMSASGARVEEVGFGPQRGDVVVLTLRFYESALPVRIEGTVMRHTEAGGFAVQFHPLPPRVRAQIASILPRIGKPC
jgi:hypothetical protein